LRVGSDREGEQANRDEVRDNLYHGQWHYVEPVEQAGREKIGGSRENVLTLISIT
jgi:hypothetical protein